MASPWRLCGGGGWVRTISKSELDDFKNGGELPKVGALPDWTEYGGPFKKWWFDPNDERRGWVDRDHKEDLEFQRYWLGPVTRPSVRENSAGPDGAEWI